MEKLNKNSKINIIRHSLAHLLATSALEIDPEAKFGVGPIIKNGFYYDILFSGKVDESILEKLERRIKELVKQDIAFKSKKLTFAEANKFFKKQSFKLELIKDIKKFGTTKLQGQNDNPKNVESVKIYQSGDFVDLCEGPHIKTAKEINPNAVKLMKIAGAYWRGSEKNQMLTRIYGVAFETKKELNDYLSLLEESKKRDHKKLGPQLGLFMFHNTAPGMPYWLPKGVIVLNELINFWREEHLNRGYCEVKTPLINKRELYETSGHWEHYFENMFISKTAENETYALKPMNCPNAMVVFANQSRSYRELPLRIGDTDTLHRFEFSGTLNGLLRAREFSQDDAHIFITEEQIKDEYLRILEIVEKFYSIFNIEYSFRLGTRPEKFMGDKKSWDKAESDLKDILKSCGKKFEIFKGDGAFYGPKIDIVMKDALERDWQTGTIQLDFQIPKRFNLKYIDKDGREKIPVVIHRVIYGSLERFIGLLIEHFAGNFPLWLAPIQVVLIPINKNHLDEARKYSNELSKNNIRVEIYQPDETLSKRILLAEIQKIPYIGIIGDKEIKNKKIAIRKHGKGDLGAQIFTDFVKSLKDEINKKSI